MPAPRLLSSAAYRLPFTYTAVCALAFLLLGTGTYLAASAAMQQQLDEDLRLEQAALAKDFAEGGQQGLLDGLRLRAASPSNNFLYALYRGSRQTAGAPRIARPTAGLSDFVFDDPQEGPDQARGILSRLPDGTQMLVAIDTEDLQRLQTKVLVLFSGAFALLVAFGIAASLALGRHLKRRLDRITSTAAAIASGDITRRIESSDTANEFDQVDAALNAMLDRVTSLLDNLRQVSSDVAHDLRTPLTRLRAAVEEGLIEGGDAMRAREALRRALDQSDALLSLFAAILRIAEIEGSDVVSGFRQVDVSRLVTAVCEMHAPALEDSGHRFGWSVEPDILLLGDRELLMQALSNLLDNAQAHTPPGTAVHVALDRQEDDVRISVIDRGGGIAQSDRERVVRRFVTLDPSRSRSGHGLGLNLVTAVMKVHGGSLCLSDNDPGLRAMLRLPVQSSLCGPQKEANRFWG